ncbi:g6516 [Coccomyxa viridis]|uniref:G6516 protein n=1 Tax=Coccomyxa viridis TaxID=1274662 RepID=A0ABP1G0F9_9CHLO
MMSAEGSVGPVSPRSDLSESQLWEVIGAESTSGYGHIVAPAAMTPPEDSPLTLHAATERSREETDSDVESAPLHPALRHVRCGNEEDMEDSEEAQKRWDQAEKYAADLRKASSTTTPKMRAKFTNRCFKMLVAGAPGIGKTTFIQNLASAYGSQDEGSPAMAHSQSKEGLVESFSIEPTAFEDFTEASDSLCTRVLLTDDTSKIHYKIFIQDTPGIYEEGAVADAVTSFVKKGAKEYMEFEQRPEREVPMTDFVDTRVDVCLYFIAPHALLPADIATIKRLGRLVPIVPIIAKGDSMTKQELEHFKEHVSTALGIGSPDSCVYNFLPEDVQEAGLDSITQVFSVISSCIVDVSVGRHWPVRSYPWGKAEALCSLHSDVPALKRLLLELSFDDIKACTEASYLEFRKEQLSLRAEAKALTEPKDASTHTSIESADWAASLRSSAPASTTNVPQLAVPSVNVEQHAKVNPVSGAEQVTPEQRKPAAQKPAAQKPAAPRRSSAQAQKIDWAPFISLAVFAVGFFTLMGLFTWWLIGVAHVQNIKHAKEEALKLDREAEHIAKHLHKGCMPQLDMEALYASLPTRNRELWALIRLTEAMAQAEGHAGAVCAQERGALAYQASLARAEMAAQEAGHVGRLRADIHASAQKRAEQLRAHATRLATQISQHVDRSVQELSRKLPIKTEKGTLHIDVKALGKVLWRSTILHIFR